MSAPEQASGCRCLDCLLRAEGKPTSAALCSYWWQQATSESAGNGYVVRISEDLETETFTFSEDGGFRFTVSSESSGTGT